MIWCSFSPDAARKVGSTPSMIQGWRPYSAISQPASIATQGSGRLQNASLRNPRYRSSCCRLASQTASAKKAMK